MKKKIVAILALLLGNIASFSQVYNFDFITVKDGIPQSQVNAICTDTLGNLWIGTMYGGLCVYNGQDFHNFYSESAFDETRVRDLHCASDGKVYAATDYGLFYYDGLEKMYPDSANNRAMMWQIAEDGDGVLWIASDIGLLRYENEQLTNVTSGENSSFNEPVYYVFASSDRVYYDKNGSLAYIQDGETDLFGEQTLNNLRISNGTCASDGKMWIASSKGIFCFKDSSVIQYTTQDGLLSNKVKQIVEDRNGHIWIAYEGTGVTYFSGEKFMSIEPSQGLGANLIDEIYVDDQNRLWVGLDGGGLALFGGFQFSHYDLHFESAKSSLVMAVLVDEDNNKWFGTDAIGLIKFDGENYKLFTTADGLTSNSVNDLAQDKLGNIWIATGDGLCKLKGGKIEYVELTDGDPVEILSLLVDEQDRIFVGTMNTGAFFIENENVTHIGEDEGLAEVVWDIFQSKDGAIYFATNRGFNVLRDGKFANYNESDGLVNNSISTIVEDHFQNIWIGTDYGMSVFNGDEFKNYTMEHGLLSNVVYLMEFDGAGNLWVGSDKGLNKLMINNEGELKEVESYTAREGFTSIECNHNAIDVDEDGMFWIGTINGATVCDPKVYNEGIYKPKIFISDLKLFYKNTDWREYTDSLVGHFQLPNEIELSYRENNMSFEFVAVNLLGAEDMKYTFILKGLDEEWSPLTAYRVASYTKIPPGDYEFCVRAFTREGISTNVACFKFTIKKPFWQRIWFYIIATLTILGLVFALIKYRTHKLERNNRELENKVRSRTFEIANQNQKLEKALKEVHEAARFKEKFIANTSHEIRTPLNAIIGFTNLLLTSPKNSKLTEKHFEYLENIHKSGENLLVIINDILDFSKIEAGKLTIEKTTFDIRETIQSVIGTLNVKAKEKQIDFQYKIDETIPRNLIGDPYRISQILINLAGNAIKFTNWGGNVNLNLKCLALNQTNCSLEFSVKDDGIGIDKDKLRTIFESYQQAEESTSRNYGGTGLGLAIVKNLVELMDGEISIESKPREGSVFYFRLSFEKGFDLPARDKLDDFDYELYDCHPKEIYMLLVEDNILNMQLAVETIKSWNSRVKIDTAENGLQALQKISEHDYHIVFMDLQMPEMDGYQAIEKIRTEFPIPKRRIPLIAMSAHAMQHEKDKCFALGVNEYTVKPFFPETIYKIIKFYTCNEVYKRILAGEEVDINSFKCNGKHEVKEVDQLKDGKIEKGMGFSFIDLRNLEKMNSGDEAKMKMLLESYLEVLPKQFNAMSTSMKAQEWELVADAAHSIKPSMFYLGLNTLFENMKLIEEIARTTGSKEKIAGFVHECKMYWTKAEVEIKSYLENLS